jgi:hypothetical protein
MATAGEHCSVLGALTAPPCPALPCPSVSCSIACPRPGSAAQTLAHSAAPCEPAVLELSHHCISFLTNGPRLPPALPCPALQLHSRAQVLAGLRAVCSQCRSCTRPAPQGRQCPPRRARCPPANGPRTHPGCSRRGCEATRAPCTPPLPTREAGGWRAPLPGTRLPRPWPPARHKAPAH